MEMDRVNIFISYAHEDERFLKWLEKHLALLLKQEQATLWHDSNISAGSEWAREIDIHLNISHIILLLVSANFLASDHFSGNEMQRIIAKKDSGTARVIPIILSPCEWRWTFLAKLQVLPKGGIPVTSSLWTHLDDAFLDIATGIRKVVEELVGKEFASEQTAEGSQQLVDFSPIIRRVTPDGLPRPKSFIGRDAELAKLMDHLQIGETCSIYAINGMGGVGKTALAAEVVGRFFDQQQEIFPGGAAWILCEGLEGPEGLRKVWSRVAYALRLEQVVQMTNAHQQRQTLTDKLKQFPRLLLVLDNIEPNLDAEAVLDVLAIPGHTTVLITARQALLPERLTSIAVSTLPASSATQLFIQRLKQRDDSRPTKEDNAWLPPLISVLDGLPLAIELVAAYTGVQRLPLKHILWEIEQDKLDATSLNADPRPDRDLRKRFHRSWMVLSLQEQRLFAGITLLQGTAFSRKSAVALAASCGKDATFLSPEQAVARLVSYALLEPAGTLYMRLHPLLREYAYEKYRAFEARYNYISEKKRKLEDTRKHGGLESRLSLEEAEFLTFFTDLIACAKSENKIMREYPIGYEGLTANEAEQVWELYRQASKKRWKTAMEEETTSFFPTIGIHANEALRIGLYLKEQGDQNLARKHLLESLEYSAMAGTTEERSLYHQVLALLDESEENVFALLDESEENHVEDPNLANRTTQTDQIQTQRSVPLNFPSTRGVIQHSQEQSTSLARRSGENRRSKKQFGFWRRFIFPPFGRR